MPGVIKVNEQFNTLSVNNRYECIEEAMNEIEHDKRFIGNKALFKFVEERLNNIAISKWREKITEEMEENFTDKSKNLSDEEIKDLLKSIRKAAEDLGISQERSIELGFPLKNFDRIVEMDRKAALDELKLDLLAKEMINFHECNGIPANVWSNFVNSSVLPKKVTLDKIKKGLSLSGKEKEEFNSLIIHDTFCVTNPLRDAVHDNYNTWADKKRVKGEQDKGIDKFTVTNFVSYKYIGKYAWEKFNKPKNPNAVRKTSQGTLLKLTIGFSLDENNAWNFMKIAGSTFAVRRDKVFLACVKCNYYVPEQVSDMLDAFNKRDPSTGKYYNPYAKLMGKDTQEEHTA